MSSVRVERERWSDRVAVVKLEGRIDSTNASEFQSKLESDPETGARLVLLDFDRVTFISSAGLRIVLMYAKQLRSRDVKFGLCSLPASIRQVMEVSGFDRILPIHASAQEAIGAPKSIDPVQRLGLPENFSLADVADNVKDIALLAIEQHEFTADQPLSEETRARALERIEAVLAKHVQELKRRRLKILKDMFALASEALNETLNRDGAGN